MIDNLKRVPLIILPQFFLYWKKLEVSFKILALVRTSNSALKKIKETTTTNRKNRKNTIPVKKKLDSSILAKYATLSIPLNTRILAE